jgi:hypothetical protein
LDEYEITKVFGKSKEVVEIVLDPYRETADIDESNNYWPRKMAPSRFELFKQATPPRGTSRGQNPMRDGRR